jgi:hypothetical protein
VRSRAGTWVVIVLTVAAIAEGVWVLRKVEAARAAAAWAEPNGDVGPLPAEYPRQAAPAPGRCRSAS